MLFSVILTLGFDLGLKTKKRKKGTPAGVKLQIFR